MSEYKNPILDAMIAIKAGNFNPKFRSFLYPINRWNSGNDKHGRMMNFVESYYINKYLFVVPPEMIMSYMHFSYKMHKDFRTKQPCLWLKYPKKQEEKSIKYDIIVKYLKEIYQWSSTECRKHHNVILSYIDNKEFIVWLDKTCGFEKKEKKIFGLVVPKKQKFKKEENVKITKSLLEF